MPVAQSRRSFLQGAGVALLGGLAGCTSRVTSDRELATQPEVQFQGNLQRWGYHPDRSVPNRVERAWELPGINTGDHTAAKASPLAAPTGDVIVPGDTGIVYAVTPDGAVRWEAATEPSVRGIHGTPVIANDTVYVGAYDGALYAFDLQSGERLWRTKLGDAIGSSPAYYDGILYMPVEFYAPSGSLFAVEAATGEIIVEDDRPTNHPHSTPAIDLDVGKLVFGSNDGNLYAWDFPSLSFAWEFETGGPIKGPIATDDGAAFFGSWDQNVYRVDLQEGTEDWSFGTDDLVMSGPGIDPNSGTVYVGSHDATIYALSARSGEERWSYQTGGRVLGSLTVTAEHVLGGSYDTYLYAIHRETGEESWRASGTGLVTSAPLVMEDGVYFTDRATESVAGSLYCLRESV